MKLLFAPVLSIALFAQSGGQPIAIPIQNPSFEQGETGWSFSAGSNVLQFNGISMAGVAYGSNISQTLSIPEMPSGIYTLSFSVQNWFYWYPGEFVASVSLSGFYESPLCSISLHPLGDLIQVSLVCPVRNMYAQNLTINFYDKGWPSPFTKVSLTFTPTQ